MEPQMNADQRRPGMESTGSDSSTDFTDYTDLFGVAIR
jgi:hypothetical protein